MTEGIEKLYTEKEAAQKYRVSSLTLYRARKAKKLSFYQVGRRVLIAEKHLQDFFAGCEKNAVSNEGK